MAQKDRYQISVKAILKNPDGKVLVLKSPVGSAFEGFYDVPGGRIDVSEFTTPLPDVLRREIREETGITDIVIHPEVIGIGRHALPPGAQGEREEVHVLYLFFLVTTSTTTVTIDHESSGYEWISLEGQDVKKLFMSGILEGVQMYLQTRNDL